MINPVTSGAPDTISRGEFLSSGGKALLAFSAVGCLMYCANKTDDKQSTGSNFSGSKTLTTAEKSTLDSQGFLNLDGMIVVKDGTTYRAYGRSCPHEGGDIVAGSATSLQCQRHTEQVYNQLGAGNGAKTTASLTKYTVTNSSGTITITG